MLIQLYSLDVDSEIRVSLIRSDVRKIDGKKYAEAMYISCTQPKQERLKASGKSTSCHVFYDKLSMPHDYTKAYGLKTRTSLDLPIKREFRELPCLISAAAMWAEHRKT